MYGSFVVKASKLEYQYSVDTRWTLHQHFGWQLVNSCRLIFDWLHLANYRLTVDKVKNEYPPSIDWDANRLPIKMLIEGID